jgi:polyhydroxyalkanoate synthase
MRRAAQTNGESLQLGWQNFLEDARQGAVRMSSTDEFKVGKTWALRRARWYSAMICSS